MSTKKQCGKKCGKKGFTLIELLVVIAIIGILSSIVLVSMGGARNSAKDATIKADLNGIRNTAEMYYIKNNSTYLTFTTEAGYTSAQTSIKDAGGTNPLVPQIAADKYCVQSTLPGGGSWCVDSTGYSGSTNITCDASNKDCASP